MLPTIEPEIAVRYTPFDDHVTEFIDALKGCAIGQLEQLLQDWVAKEAILDASPASLCQIACSCERGLCFVLDGYERWSAETIGEVLESLFQGPNGVAPALLRAWYEHLQEQENEPYLREVETRCAAWLQ